MEAANDEDTKTGIQEMGSESVVVRRWLEATGREMDARMDNLAFWLYAALGKITTTGSAPYTHVIENNGGQKPSLTEFWRDELTPASKLEAYPGLKVQSLTIRSQEGGKILVQPELIGRGSDSNGGYFEVTASMPVLNRDNPLVHGKFTKFELGGYELKSVLQSFELVIAPQYDINSEYGADGVLVSQLECSGLTVTCNFGFNHDANTKALIEKVLTQTGVSLQAVITMGSHSATFDLPNIFLDDTAVTGGKAKLKKAFSGRAYYDLLGAKAIQATIVNGTDTYIS
ncbi:hypothetical protein D3C86_1283500 [compost metagenome]